MTNTNCGTCSHSNPQPPPTPSPLLMSSTNSSDQIFWSWAIMMGATQVWSHSRSVVTHSIILWQERVQHDLVMQMYTLAEENVVNLQTHIYLGMHRHTHSYTYTNTHTHIQPVLSWALIHENQKNPLFALVHYMHLVWKRNPNSLICLF